MAYQALTGGQLPRLLSPPPRPRGARASGPGVVQGASGPGIAGPPPVMQQSPALTGNPSSTAPPGPATVPPAPTPLPADPLYETQKGLNQQNYDTTIAGLDQSQRDTIRSFGLDDATDPFSRAALLNRLYQQRTAGTTNKYAATGQLYAGSLQNAQNQNAANEGQQYDALRKQQNSALATLAARRQGAQGTLGQANLNALTASVGRAASTLPDLATVPNPTMTPGATATRTRTVAGRKQYFWNGNWHSVPPRGP